MKTGEVVANNLADLCTAPLATLGQAQPRLQECLGYLAATASSSCLEYIVNRMNHLELLCKGLARILGCLGSTRAVRTARIQQLTEDQAAAMVVLGACLEAVCNAYEHSDENTAILKITSAVPATGEVPEAFQDTRLGDISLMAGC